jgi:hypothetical protein
MTRVRIRGGYLNIGRRHRPGGPGEPTDPTDPDYGVDEGEPPEVEPPEIEPPPGIWPPPTVGHPVHPIAPGGRPTPPPGAIWPPVEGPVEGLFIVLAHIPDHGWKYIVIDPDAWERPDVEPGHPIAPGVPPGAPKR